MFEWIFTPEGWVALATLTALELVLGIDNIVFISILATRLPEDQQDRARRIGLSIAAIGRLLLLFSIVWIMGLTETLFTIFGEPISWRDVILITGGLFLIYKATSELHHKLEGKPEGPDDGEGAAGAARASFAAIMMQVFLLDMVFALDSIITAVGLVKEISMMATAIVLSVILMVALSRVVHAFVIKHPTIKVLALSFLMMIGMVLIAEGFGVQVPKGYIYFAMGFSLFVEVLNIRLRKVSKPVELRQHYE